MFSRHNSPVRPPGAWRRPISTAALLLAICLPLGCTKDKLAGAGYKDNSLGDQCRQRRPADGDTELLGVSKKSQQIERDLGVQ